MNVQTISDAPDIYVLYVLRVTAGISLAVSEAENLGKRCAVNRYGSGATPFAWMDHLRFMRRPSRGTLRLERKQDFNIGSVLAE